MRQPGGRRPAPPVLVLAQDLANTLNIELGRDRLTDAAGLSEFAVEHGITALDLGAADLPTVVRIREALREVCAVHADGEPRADAAELLEEGLAGAAIVLGLAPDGSVRLLPVSGLRGVDLLLAHLAAGIATAAGDGSWQRLKTCAADGCRWVYYDWSPAAASRWCTMRLCGNRAKMRAYRARQRQTTRP
jgi:predicted RNA-binding Zn ribbon-like protein